MTDIVPGSPQDQAADWLARRAGGVDLTNDTAFASWLGQSSANANAWADAERVWASVPSDNDLLLAAMRRVALEARPDSARDEFHDPDDNGEIAALGRFSLKPAIGWAAAAAMVIITLGIGWQLGWLRSPGTPVTMAQTRYESPFGQRRVVHLADASIVTLDSDSAMSVSLTSSRREVLLERGQAFFSVEHDPTRPFAVSAAGGTITDMGTEFDVIAKADGLRVVVTKGKVSVRDRIGTETLVAGEGFDTSPATRGRLHNPDTDALLAWRSGFLEFRNSSLAEAISDMNRYGKQTIVLADPAAAALPVAGRYAAGDSENFARSIAELYRLRLSHNKDGKIVLGGDGR